MSELSLGQIKGLTVNSNIVTVPSGHTLYAPGHVIQIVTGYTATGVTNSSTTQVDTGLSATITPKSANSKILVVVNQSVWKSSGAAENQFNLFLYRDSTQITTLGLNILATGSAVAQTGIASNSWLDSPATTSAVTYKTKFSNYVASSSVVAQQYSNLSFITLMEIAA